MFSSEDVAECIEEIVYNESYTQLKSRLPKFKEHDILALFDYALRVKNCEILDVLVHNCPTLSDQHKQKALLVFVDKDLGKLKSVLASFPNTDANDAMRLAGQTANFGAVKILQPFANQASIDRAFECCMESHHFGVSKFLLPFISEHGDHVNSLIYASDAGRQDLFDALYTIPRAQQAFENIKMLVQDVFDEGYNIQPIKDRLEMDLQNQRIHEQIDLSATPSAVRKM